MKILQLIYESLGSPFGYGGAGVRAYEIYKSLKDRHEVTLLCMKYPGTKDGEQKPHPDTALLCLSRSPVREKIWE